MPMVPMPAAASELSVEDGKLKLSGHRGSLRFFVTAEGVYVGCTFVRKEALEFIAKSWKKSKLCLEGTNG